MKEIIALKDLAFRAYNGIYSNPERLSEQFVTDYSNDLKGRLEQIPEEHHDWVTEKYVSLLRKWLSSQTSIYSSWISGASNYPARRMQKLNGWADNHYKTFDEWRDSIVKKVKRID